MVYIFILYQSQQLFICLQKCYDNLHLSHSIVSASLDLVPFWYLNLARLHRKTPIKIRITLNWRTKTSQMATPRRISLLVGHHYKMQISVRGKTAAALNKAAAGMHWSGDHQHTERMLRCPGWKQQTRYMRAYTRVCGSQKCYFPRGPFAFIIHKMKLAPRESIRNGWRTQILHRRGVHAAERKIIMYATCMWTKLRKVAKCW
jgi:hypothetical protein